MPALDGEEGFTVKVSHRCRLAYVNSSSTYWEPNNYFWVQRDCTWGWELESTFSL